jgi:4-hydroxybenzoate polyprenyltransferase/phosphoserine phosphatase
MNENARPAIDDARKSAEAPLVVDLDGTLLRTDLLYEKFALLLFAKPWLLALVPLWLLRGKAALKREFTRRVDLDVETLPVNTELLDWLRAEKARGRTLALVSASDDTLVRRVAQRFGDLFDIAQGSDGTTNLAGACKLEALAARFGANFTYAGDERRDIVIWEHCKSAVLAGHGCGLRASLSPQVAVTGSFAVPKVTISTWARELRVQQWAKNALLFVPLLLSGAFLDPQLLSRVALGFLAFSLLASASYLFNDLVDLRADRMHRSKSKRPLASGDLPLRAALMALPVMALLVAALLTRLPVEFTGVALIYLAVTLLYSFVLKRTPILDLLALGFLFTVRILAGIAATQTSISPWLLVFCMFFFFSLATVKRYSECKVMEAEGRTELTGRGYHAADANTLMAMGVASGFCSSLVFFLFLIDPLSPVSAYSRPELLWLVCAVLAYWLGRAWLLAGRGEMNDDVVVFALKDRVSLVLGALCALLGLLANL